jgi:hypothetical protein
MGSDLAQIAIAYPYVCLKVFAQGFTDEGFGGGFEFSAVHVRPILVIGPGFNRANIPDTLPPCITPPCFA